MSMRVKVFIVVVMAFCLAVKAQKRVLIGDLYYNLSGATASVAYNHGSSNYDFDCRYKNEKYIIPSIVQYDGLDYKVVEIGTRAFSGYGSSYKSSPASSIIIPNTIERIQEGAFRRCSNLISFVIPSSVKTMDKTAFDGCSLLREIFYLSATPPNGWCATSFTYVPNKENYITPSYSWGDANIIQMITFEENVFTYTGVAPTAVWESHVIGYEALLEMPTLQKNVGKYAETIPVTFTKGDESITVDIEYKYEIKPALLTAFVNDETRLYGEENPEFKISITGFVNGEDESVITKFPTASTTAKNSSQVGTYPITLSGGEAENYVFNYESGELSITPRELKVSVSDYQRAYAEENPHFVPIYEGFVCNDNEASLSVRPTATTIATETSDVGTYPISIDGGRSHNYTFTYSGGTLTIVKAEQNLDWSQDLSNLTVGDQIELQAKPSSGLPVEYTMDENDAAELYKAGSKTYLDCKKAGQFQIRAIQNGNDNYYPSQKANKIIRITGYVFDDPILTIKQADNGSVNTQVNKGCVYAFTISPSSGWKIHSVTFNDTDVTNQLDGDNTLMTPAIKSNSTLSVVYEQSDGNAVYSARESSVKIQGMSFGARVTNASVGDIITVYSINGILQKNIKAENNTIDIPLQTGEIYIVKVGTKTMKLSL